MNKHKEIIASCILIIVTVVGLFLYTKQHKVQLTNTPTETINTIPTKEIQKTTTNKNINQNSTAGLSRDALVVKAFDSQKIRDYLSAVNYAKQALERDPKNTNLMQLIASFYNIDKKYTEAMNWIDKALAINKTNEIYWETKIEITKNLYVGKKENIISVYKDAIANTEIKINMVTNYASYLESIKDTQGSIQQWQKAIELVPENTIIYQAEIDRLNR